MPNGPNDILLSFILCSRNDRHQGNPMWRLQTTLNFLADSACRQSMLDRVEVVVSDWGSDEPIRHTLKLTAAAGQICRFVDIPKPIATSEQRDSPFPEVLALNAAVIRSRGTYVGRIDQDTLVTDQFFAEFSARFDGPSEPGNAGAKAVYYVGRRSLPYPFVRTCPDFANVTCFLDRYRNVLPVDGPHIKPWYDAPVGILVMHRALWYEAKGYDERLIYWGWMETDLISRLGRSYTVHDIKTFAGRSFYHLEHVPVRIPRIPRRKNRREFPDALAVNDEGWGLSRHRLAIHEYDGSVIAVDGHDRFSGHMFPHHHIRALLGIVGLWVRYSVLLCYGIPRNLVSGHQPCIQRHPEAE